MVKGVIKFPTYIDGEIIYDENHLYSAIARKKWQESRAENKRLVNMEIQAQKALLVKALERKKKRDIDMQEHARKKFQALSQRIEQYEVDIQRLQQARSLCVSALSMSKKEACDEYKELHPCTDVKKIQNKIYSLELKLARI